MPDESTAFCCRCKEDFPVLAPNARPMMGTLTPLTALPDRIRRRFASWRDHDEGAYLCGNCYFDILDELDDVDA